MTSSTRVIVNTLAQYGRTVLSVLISFYTSRIILENLGVDDYGINDLVAGIISMLSFLNVTLSQSTQRYLSYYQGKNDVEMVRKVFNNSFIIQLVLGVVMCLVFVSLTSLLFDKVLIIDEERQIAAHWIYYFMIISLFISTLMTPYSAALIARENIILSSIVQICISIIKIPIALSIAWVPTDKLIWYGFCNLLIVVAEFLVYLYYCRRKYPESASVTFHDFDRSLFREMFSFTGWTFYGSSCIVIRNRGFAILINRFFSVAVNGAMGIGGMISSQLLFLSTALTNSLRPQIIKSEAEGDRDRMYRLTELCCKSSILLLSIVAIPAIFEMDNIMGIWLVHVPQYAIFFAQAYIIAALIDQFSTGLQIANQAIGNIKNYTIMTNTLKVITLPAIYIALRMDCDVRVTMYVYIFFESVCSVMRLFFLKITIGYSIRRFVRNVLTHLLIPFVASLIICYFMASMTGGIGFITTFVLNTIVISSLAYIFGLTDTEKVIVINIIKKIKR